MLVPAHPPFWIQDASSFVVLLSLLPALEGEEKIDGRKRETESSDFKLTACQQDSSYAHAMKKRLLRLLKVRRNERQEERWTETRKRGMRMGGTTELE